MRERDPVYALADLTVQSRDVPHEMIVDEIIPRSPRGSTSSVPFRQGHAVMTGASLPENR